MKTTGAAVTLSSDGPTSSPWFPRRAAVGPTEATPRTLRSLASELAATAHECSPSELPQVIAELAAAQAVALQRIINEKVAPTDTDRPLSWADAALLSGGLHLTEDWLKKNRHKLPFTVQVSRKKWYISEKSFRRWLETRRRA